MLLLTLVTAFINLGGDTIHEWDEARHGQIALEMLERGDYVNYYYGGEPDTWMFKPPLAVWSIAVSFRMFGFNEFALRLPSAIAAVLTVLIFYTLIRSYHPPRVAMLSCLVLISCKGLIWFHVGRTGDTDALLVLFLMLFAYFALQAVDFDRGWAWVGAGAALGLAFYTKGPVSLFFGPGIAAYLLVRRRLASTLRQPWLWAGAALFVLIVLSWYGLISAYGTVFEDDGYGTNAWERLLYYDSVGRLTEVLEENDSGRTPAFVWRAVRNRLKPWSYLLYLCLAAGTVQAIRRYPTTRHTFAKFLMPGGPPSLAYAALLIVLTVSAVLTLARTGLVWYVAPMVPFLALLTYMLYDRVTGSRRGFRVTLVALIVVALAGHWVRLGHADLEGPSVAMREHASVIRQADEICWAGRLGQQHRLYLSWYGSVAPGGERCENDPGGWEPIDAANGLYIVRSPRGTRIVFDGRPPAH